MKWPLILSARGLTREEYKAELDMKVRHKCALKREKLMKKCSRP